MWYNTFMGIGKAYDLARGLMNEHGLTDWQFEFDNAKRRFGVTKFRSKTISMSRDLITLNEEARVTNTILHEIAHALCGPRVGHSYAWRRKAVEIGCDGNRLYDSNIVEKPKALYTATCPNGHTSEAHRKPRRGRKVACGTCCRQLNFNRYSDKYTLSYVRN